MSERPLDAAWTRWLEENLGRQCDPQELLGILREQGFSLDSIRRCMGDRFPAGASAPGRKPLDAAWNAWLKENLEGQCDPQQLVEILLRHRFSLDSIRQSMGARFPASASDYRAIAQPRLVRDTANRALRRVDTDKLQLYTLDGFMVRAECDAIATLIDRHLRPSTVTLPGTDRYFRTSRTCDLSLLHSPLVAALDEKIAAALGIRSSYGEGIQGQRYDAGQEFKPHTDFFEPGTDEYQEHASSRGNRTWTFMVYLNEGMTGGGTRFVAIDRTFHPRQGQALVWNNLYADGLPNHDTLHSGMPVEHGCKIIITKWFRERGSGPMFYED